MQELLGDLECRHLDDRSCKVVNPRDRHVATVSYGAEQIACAISTDTVVRNRAFRGCSRAFRTDLHP